MRILRIAIALAGLLAVGPPYQSHDVGRGQPRGTHQPTRALTLAADLATSWGLGVAGRPRHKTCPPALYGSLASAHAKVILGLVH